MKAILMKCGCAAQGTMGLGADAQPACIVHQSAFRDMLINLALRSRRW